MTTWMSGKDVGRVRRVEGCFPLFGGVEVTLLCDVTNPLLGKDGATFVYGAQKGGTVEELRELEQGMCNAALVLQDATAVDVRTLCFGGAGGGMGAALHACVGGRFESGAEYMARVSGLDDAICCCDVVVTGEGCFDEPSVRYGKACGRIVERAVGLGKRTVVICGVCGTAARREVEICELATLFSTDVAMGETLRCIAAAAKCVFSEPQATSC